MSTTLEQLQYGFDRDSRRTWRQRATTQGWDNAYAYDSLNQVTTGDLGTLNLAHSAIAGIPSDSSRWQYDETGNWHGYQTLADGAPALTQERTHDKGNRLMDVSGAAMMRTDRAGRITQTVPGPADDWSSSYQITWDAWSRITAVASVDEEATVTPVATYAYDGLTRRITRHTAATETTLHSYYNDKWRPVEERHDSETTAALSYLWGSRHRDDLVRRDRAVGDTMFNETRYILMDYFSPASITDENGNVTERYQFSAFGLRTVLNPDFTVRSDSECGMEFGFQGQFEDIETGWLNYGYRYYSPCLGRWMCKDPIGESGGTELYGMVRNNAVNHLDHLGLVDFYGPNSNTVKTQMEATQEGLDQLQRITENDQRNGTRTIVRDQNGFDDPETKGGYNPQTGVVVVPDKPWQYESNRGPTPSTQAQVTVHELDHREQDQNKKLQEMGKQPDEKCGTKAEKSGIDAENRFNKQDKSGPTRPDRLNHNVIRPQ